MTPTAKIAIIRARLRGEPVARNGWGRRPARCSFCSREKHDRRTCPFRRLKLWTDGDAIFIAATAAEARAIALDPIPDDMLEDCDVPLEKWRRITDEPLELLVEGKQVPWSQHVWITMNGPGILALNGELAMWRRAI
jgi:hypothetical protein